MFCLFQKLLLYMSSHCTTTTPTVKHSAHNTQPQTLSKEQLEVCVAPYRMAGRQPDHGRRGADYFQTLPMVCAVKLELTVNIFFLLSWVKWETEWGEGTSRKCQSSAIISFCIKEIARDDCFVSRRLKHHKPKGWLKNNAAKKKWEQLAASLLHLQSRYIAK